MKHNDRDQVARLSDTERDLLSLLGQGHTAKSIASIRGMSEAAVNERFRSARRKTGISSSREIARIFAAQENRHEEIGLSETRARCAETNRPGALLRASLHRRWKISMLAATGLIAVVMFAYQTTGAETAAPKPVLYSEKTTSAATPDFSALHAEMAAGVADPAWSAGTEAALSSVYRRTPAFAEAIAKLDIICTASLCEARGVSRANLSREENSALLSVLSWRELQEGATDQRLQFIGQKSSFRRDRNDNPIGMSFTAYWRRVE